MILFCCQPRYPQSIQLNTKNKDYGDTRESKGAIYLLSIKWNYFQDQIMLAQTVLGMKKEVCVVSHKGQSLEYHLWQHPEGGHLTIGIICYINNNQMVTAEENIPLLEWKHCGLNHNSRWTNPFPPPKKKSLYMSEKTYKHVDIYPDTKQMSIATNMNTL